MNCGWELSNGNGKVKWFEGDVAPTSVELITADESNLVDDDENGKVCLFVFFCRLRLLNSFNIVILYLKKKLAGSLTFSSLYKFLFNMLNFIMVKLI